MAVAGKKFTPASGGRHARIGGTIHDVAVSRSPARVWRSGSVLPRFAPDDPAVLLISDFSRVKPWTVSGERSIDAALRDMTCAGVGALLVVSADVVMGLVAEEDIEGRRTLDLLRYSGFGSRSEIRVAHVMSPWGCFPVLDWRSICASRIRHLEEWVRNTRAPHALLVEQRDDAEYVRGLLCREHVERALGCVL